VLQHVAKTGLKAGDPEFWGALQNATTVLWNGLCTEDTDDYTQAAIEWSMESLPPHIQLRYVMLHIVSHTIHPAFI
jgi:hypothetical protein